MARIFLFGFAFFCLINKGAAQITQTIRGAVYDSESQTPIPGAKVQIYTADTNEIFRTLTDFDGLFEILNVPIGKHRLVTTFMSYSLNDRTIEVISGKENVLQIYLSETFVEQEEVIVSGARKNGEVINEMALISAQQFSVEETNRYPGSRSDPARMASNFAGVQGADDSRNDIVVRGNSPLGVVYKIEGVDIPNPNHFAISGSSGGPVSIINNKTLSNSDFFMSAFPAEYGNSLSGIFDLKMRNGNTNTNEFTGQFGFLGTEVLSEGPLNRGKRSSYLITGRYSTLSIFQKLGIRIGTDAVPTYGDGAFKFNFPLKKGGVLSFYGVGGKSNIAILISEQKTYSTELYGEGDRDQYFGTAMISSGISYKKSLNDKTFMSSTLAVSFDEQHSHHDYLIRHLEYNGKDTNVVVDSIYPLLDYSFKTTKISGFTSVNHKINRRNIIKFGANVDFFTYNNIDSVLNNNNNEFITRWNYKGNAFLIQPFVQYKLRITEKMDFTAGLHAQYYSLSNSLSPAEPRLGWKYKFRKNQSVSAGAGMHSQTQPYYTYTYQRYDSENNPVLLNKNMDFTRSIHTGLGYEKTFNKGINIRTEAYYQYVYNVPVTVVPSSFSLINQGSGFARFFPDSLENSGTGENYGLELTIQKYFDKSFFFLISTSLYNSTYTASDGIKRNTSYNGKYTANFLMGKEFKINDKNILGIGVKVTVAGGKRYGYVDLEASKERQEIIYKDSLFNERQFKDYFRADLKVSYRINAKKFTHEFGLDLVNILGIQNILSLSYAPNLANPSAEPISVKNQLGFLPIFYYKIDFKFRKKVVVEK